MPTEPSDREDPRHPGTGTGHTGTADDPAPAAGNAGANGTDEEARPREADPADSAEQRQDLTPQEDDPLTGIDPAKTNEADASEQARVVPVDEDDYR
ncbi:hypothetical protein [Streptomyces sp. NPDC059398]|uniref:hypothetical protein n=1 Tax=Streptomyces sp. NPDC059398 TaxID=3346820 RepID=UPI00367B52E0